MSTHFDRALELLVKAGNELDAGVRLATKSLPPDRLHAFEGTGEKILLTFERLGAQIVYLADQFERLSKSRAPSGPGRVLTFRPRRR